MNDKITGNEPAMPCKDGYWKGLTIRQQFANNCDVGVPEDFYWKKFREINERKKINRDTKNHPSTVMYYDEIAEVKNAWKVFMADSLIAELNK